MRKSLFAAALAGAAFSAAAFAGTDLRLASFTALNVHSGAHATLRYGKVQRVTVIKGDLKKARIEVHGKSLDISGCEGFCIGQADLEVEISAPSVAALKAHSGGAITANGTFPKQSHLDVEAHSGGAVDADAIPADAVTATAHSGGSVRVKALSALNASANSGGAIAYTGHPVHIESHGNSGGSIAGQ